MERNQDFGKALRALRTHKRLTQEDFTTASSRTYLSTLERGLKSPTLEKIEALASVMGVHPLSLLAASYLVADGSDSLPLLFARVESELKSVDLVSHGSQE